MPTYIHVHGSIVKRSLGGKYLLVVVYIYIYMNDICTFY